MRSTWLAAVALLLAGGLAALWFVFGNVDELGGERAIESESLAPRAAGDAVEAALVRESGPAEREPEARTALETEAKPGASLASDDDDDESALLVGRLIDERGEPVVGAQVWAETGLAFGDAPLDMEDYGLSRRWALKRQAESDEDGRFAFTEDLRPGRLRIAVRADGTLPHYDDGLQMSDARPHDLGELTLSDGVTLTGRVVDLSGAGVEGVELLQAVVRGVGGSKVTVPTRGIPLGSTDATGAFRVGGLAHGPWRLIVDSPRHRVREQEGRTAAPGEVQDGLLFVLEPGERVEGIITGMPPALADSLRVEARVRDSELRERPEGMELHPRARRASVAPDGTFTIEGLAPGVSHVLTAWHDDGGEWRRHRSITTADEVWPGSRGVELEFLAEASVVLQVVDADTQEPVENFVLWAGIDRGERTQLGVLSQEDDDQNALAVHPGGRARFEGLRPPEDGGEVKIRVRATGYEDLERAGIELARGEEKDVGTVALTPSAVARVHVTDAKSGAPLEGARVFLCPEGERAVEWFLAAPESNALGNERVRFGETDAEGWAALPLIPGERSVVRVGAVDHVPSEELPVPASVTDDVVLEVALTTGATVVVRVVDPVGSPVPEVGVLRQQSETRGGAATAEFGWFGTPSQVTDREGIARFENLAAGDWLFGLAPEQSTRRYQLEPSREDVESVRLVEGVLREVTLRGEARGRLFGRLTEANLPLAGAELTLAPRVEGGEGGGRERGRGRGGFGRNGQGSRYSGQSGHDGSYEFAGIVAGEYFLTTRHPGRYMSERIEVSVYAGDNPLDIDLSVAVIEGRVTSLEGDPLGGIRVDVRTPDGRGASGGGGGAELVENEQGQLQQDRGSGRPMTVTTDRDGRYEVRGVLVDEPLRVRVSGRFVQPSEQNDLELAPNEVRRNVDFELAAAGWLRVVVEGADLPRNVIVVATRDREGKAPLRRWARSWGGRPYTFESMPPGAWDLAVVRYEGREQTELGKGAAEVIAVEETTVTLRLD